MVKIFGPIIDHLTMIESVAFKRQLGESVAQEQAFNLLIINVSVFVSANTRLDYKCKKKSVAFVWNTSAA